MGRIKELDCLVIVPVKIRFDETSNLQQVQQTFLLQGLQNVLKIPKVIWHQILTGKTDRSEACKSNNESLIKRI